jgi:hypothetical protein
MVLAAVQARSHWLMGPADPVSVTLGVGGSDTWLGPEVGSVWSVWMIAATLLHWLVLEDPSVR